MGDITEIDWIKEVRMSGQDVEGHRDNVTRREKGGGEEITERN